MVSWRFKTEFSIRAITNDFLMANYFKIVTS